MSRGHVWIIVWGGGDEPEGPAIQPCATKAAALRQARQWFADINADSSVTKMLRDLSQHGSWWEEGCDTFLNLERHEVIS